MDTNNKIDLALLEQDDRIMAFLKGRMTVDEEKLFMDELARNKEMKDRAIAMARLVKGLKDVGTRKDNAVKQAFLFSKEDNVVRSAQSVMGKKKNRFSPRTTAIWFSAAASIILIVLGGIKYTGYRHTISIADEYVDAFETSSIIRGSDEDSETTKKMEKLFKDVKAKKDLDNTIKELSVCWELSKMEVYNDYTDYSAEIGWNLAIAYLYDNDKKEAQMILEEMTKTYPKGTAVGDKVEELIEKL